MKIQEVNICQENSFEYLRMSSSKMWLGKLGRTKSLEHIYRSLDESQVQDMEMSEQDLKMHEKKRTILMRDPKDQVGPLEDTLHGQSQLKIPLFRGSQKLVEKSVLKSVIILKHEDTV